MLLRTFQTRVRQWMLKVFPPEVIADKKERAYRLLEEVYELVQAIGVTKEECIEQLNYTYSRPVGEARNELGGVMLCIASVADCIDTDMEYEAELELRRVSTPEMIAKIQTKQASKPHCSPLPGIT